MLADAWERSCSEQACSLFTILGTARSREVAPDRRVPRGPRRHGRRRTLPSLRGRHHLLAGRRGREAAARRRSSPSPAIAALLGEGQASADEIAVSVRKLFEATGVRAAARCPVRRPPVGRADVPRPDRARRRLVPRRPDPPALPRAARAARAPARLGRWEAQRDGGAPRAAVRDRDRRADRRASRRRAPRRRRFVTASAPRRRATRSSSSRCSRWSRSRRAR